MKGDLHFHSYYSDGSHGIEYLVDRAAKLGLGVAALTDHDTFYGCAQFAALARKIGIVPVSGIELSSFDQTEIHILGYNIDYLADNTINAELSEIHRRRMDKLDKILYKLNQLNVFISRDDLAEFNSRSLGRGHVAYAMVKKGYAKNRADAFSRYLGEGKPCYVQEFLMSPYQAVEVIKASGGIAVLAHPGRLNLSRFDFEKLLKNLRDAGLDGIESYYPAHSSDMTDYYNALAHKYNMIVTCGSDFHNQGSFDTVCYDVPAQTLGKLKEAP